jgi:hypothetical protein
MITDTSLFVDRINKLPQFLIQETLPYVIKGIV